MSKDCEDINFTIFQPNRYVFHLYIRKSNPRFQDQGRKQIKGELEQKNLMAYNRNVNSEEEKDLLVSYRWILMLLFVSDTDQAFNEAF